MKTYMSNILLMLVILIFASYFTFSQYSSISIRGPEKIKPGSTNSFECYANFNYGGTPTLIQGAKWEIVDMNPKLLDPSAYLSLNFNSIKVTDFVIGEFEYTLKCTYNSLQNNREKGDRPIWNCP